MARLRTVTAALPADAGVHDGLAYSLWLPPDPQPPRAGIIILHGAGSSKESHHDFARFVLPAGFAAIAFDQRGHGASEGPMDARLVEDVKTIASLLRAALGDPAVPVALRGSSMGGYLAILAAQAVQASAVVAICPASAEGLLRGLDAGTLRFEADVAALESFLRDHELEPAARALTVPLLLLHAEGDEQVPVQNSRELADAVSSPGSRLIVIPGGHHRSIQHDQELQSVSLRFLEQALGVGRRRGASG